MKGMRKLIPFLFLTALAAAQYLPTNANLKARDWFQNARFGMFIHWGVYSVPARGEWYMNNEKVPIATYKAYAKEFTAAKYDPAAWAALAKEAGMKYVVLTAKHHDGFTLYD